MRRYLLLSPASRKYREDVEDTGCQARMLDRGTCAC